MPSTKPTAREIPKFQEMVVLKYIKRRKMKPECVLCYSDDSFSALLGGETRCILESRVGEGGEVESVLVVIQ